MALILMESFDTYATAALTGAWTTIGGGAYAPTVSAGNGRRSTQCLRTSFTDGGGVGRPLSIVPDSPVPSGDTCVCGFAFKANRLDTVNNGSNAFDPSSGSAQSSFLLLVRQGNTTHVGFRINSNGTITALRGQSSLTTLGTTSIAVSEGGYQFLEFKVVIHDTTGSIEIRIDGAVALTLTNIDTKNTGSATWDEISINRLVENANISTTWDFDDLYLLDGTTTADDPRNTFLGDSRVDATLPNAVGTHSDGTPSGGAVDNYTMVDEATHDSDTTYNTFSVAADLDTYNYPTAPVAGAFIYGVQVRLWCRKEDAGGATLRAVTRLGGTDYFGSSLSPTTGYTCKRQIWAQKPSDSADWTDTDYNAAEFGVEKET